MEKKELTRAMVAISEHAGIDPHVNDMYHHDVQGAGAVVTAVRNVLAFPGTVERLAVCVRENSGPPMIDHVLAFGVGVGNEAGDKCVRWVGDDGRPNGGGSSSVIPTWYDYRLDEAHLCAALGRASRAGGEWVFRLREGA